MFDDTRILLLAAEHHEEAADDADDARAVAHPADPTPTDTAALVCMVAWLAGCLLLGIFVYDDTLLS